MSSSPKLGPVALCTLVANDGLQAAQAYCDYMHQQITASTPLTKETACALGLESLEGNPSWVLANTQGRQWLHIIEAPEAPARDALTTYGWLAMEVLVDDVDQLAGTLESSPFELLRPPADLDVSDKIRACQARGPAGEILYLTQVRGEAPPFELPQCEAPVDHLFIPVLSSPDRDSSLRDYSAISESNGLSFETKITVINQARNFDLERRHPVATLQLAECALIEIDQIAETVTSEATISTGVANIALYCSQPPEPESQALTSGPLAGYSAKSRKGSAGERFTLIYS